MGLGAGLAAIGAALAEAAVGAAAFVGIDATAIGALGTELGGFASAGLGADTAGIVGAIGAKAVIGAGAGALLGGVTGTDPGQGALLGGITGGFIGAGGLLGEAAGIGSFAGDVLGGAAGGAVGAGATGGDPGMGALTGAGSGALAGAISGGGNASVAGGPGPSAGSIAAPSGLGGGGDIFAPPTEFGVGGITAPPPPSISGDITSALSGSAAPVDAGSGLLQAPTAGGSLSGDIGGSLAGGATSGLPSGAPPGASLGVTNLDPGASADLSSHVALSQSGGASEAGFAPQATDAGQAGASEAGVAPQATDAGQAGGGEAGYVPRVYTEGLGTGVGAGTGFGSPNTAGSSGANPELGGVYGAGYGATTEIPPPTFLQSVQNAVGYTPNVVTEAGLGTSAGSGGAAAPPQTSAIGKFLADPGLKTGGDALSSNANWLAPAALIGYQGLKANAGLSGVPGYGALSSTAAQLGAQGQQLQNYLTSGTLPPGVQQSLTQAGSAAKAAIRSQYASHGMSGSSAEQADLAAVDQKIVTNGVGIATTLLTQGVSESNLSAQLYNKILSANLQNDAALGTALSTLASASARPTINIQGTASA